MSDTGDDGSGDGTAADLAPRARARSTPGKLTADVLARICDAIAAGSTRVGACAAEDVSDAALRALRKAHPDVDEMVSTAEGAGAQYYAMRVATAEAGAGSTDDWRRWAWLADKLHPSVFAPPPQRVEQTGADGAPLAVQFYVPHNPRIPSGE